MKGLRACLRTGQDLLFCGFLVLRPGRCGGGRIPLHRTFFSHSIARVVKIWTLLGSTRRHKPFKRLELLVFSVKQQLAQELLITYGGFSITSGT